MNFSDILSTICDTRLPIPLSAFGIDLTLPLLRPHSSLDTLPLLLESRLQPTPKFDLSGANCKITDVFWRLEDAGTRQNN